MLNRAPPKTRTRGDGCATKRRMSATVWSPSSCLGCPCHRHVAPRPSGERVGRWAGWLVGGWVRAQSAGWAPAGLQTRRTCDAAAAPAGGGRRRAALRVGRRRAPRREVGLHSLAAHRGVAAAACCAALPAQPLQHSASARHGHLQSHQPAAAASGAGRRRLGREGEARDGSLERRLQRQRLQRADHYRKPRRRLVLACRLLRGWRSRRLLRAQWWVGQCCRHVRGRLCLLRACVLLRRRGGCGPCSTPPGPCSPAWREQLARMPLRPAVPDPAWVIAWMKHCGERLLG